MSRIARVGFDFDVSAVAYADPETGQLVTMPPQPVMAMHEFFETDDHQLGHRINGQLRATVPPEGWEEYARQWPDCAELVTELAAAGALKAPQDENPPA